MSDALPPIGDSVARLRAAGCVFAEDEAALLHAEATSSGRLEAMIARRVEGEPLELILGWVEFCGARYLVTPRVFVPRRRTELMVREACSLLADLDADAAVVVDVCCGSGAVGAAVAARACGVKLYSADIDAAAVDCARLNVPDPARVFCGDLFDALPGSIRGRINLVVANTPYVPTAQIARMPPEARLYEPAVALDGGRDGLEVQRRLATQAASWLAPGGHVLVEVSENQAPASKAIFEAAGLRPRAAGQVIVATRR